jgi:hypothetical protein
MDGTEERNISRIFTLDDLVVRLLRIDEIGIHVFVHKHVCKRPRRKEPTCEPAAGNHLKCMLTSEEALSYSSLHIHLIQILTSIASHLNSYLKPSSDCSQVEGS